MNALIYFLLATLTMASVCSQNCSIKKGYAYERATISGTMPRKTLDESGKEIERPVKKMSSWFIYIESKSTCSLQTERIWIGNKAYNVIQEEIIDKPVVLQYSYPGKQPDTLVRPTSNKILRLQPMEELQIKPNKKITRELNDSKIIIEYRSKSGKYFFGIKEIQRLTPLVLQ